MAWLLGATSGKFAIAGAVLLVQGRVDGNLVMLAIAPEATTSAIATRLADNLDRGRERARAFKVQIRREYTTVAIPRREASPAEGAEVRLGMDFLADNPVVVDFASHSLHLIDRYQMHAVPDHYVRLDLARDARGRFAFGIARAGSPPSVVKLELGQAVEQDVGCIQSLHGPSVPAATASEGIGLFDGQTIIFDLAHQVIWVRKGPAANRLLCG